MANAFENELYEKNQHLMICKKKQIGVKWKCVISDTCSRGHTMLKSAFP